MEQMAAWPGNDGGHDMGGLAAPVQTTVETQGAEPHKSFKHANQAPYNTNISMQQKIETWFDSLLDIEPPPDLIIDSPANLSKLEHWEMTAGHKHSSNDSEGGSLAFSREHLATGQPASFTKQVTVSTLTIPAVHLFEKEYSKEQDLVCVVLKGKLLVQLYDEPPFVLNSHGVFRVKAGGAGSVVNLCRDDAVLHITIVNVGIQGDIKG